MSEPEERKSNNIWGEKFTRTASIIFLVAILITASRYIYLKVTDQYPATYEEQELIQYPHLQQMNNAKTKDLNAKDSVLQDARSRQ